MHAIRTYQEVVLLDSPSFRQFAKVASYDIWHRQGLP